MLRLLILLVLYKAEAESTEQKKYHYSVDGVKRRLETLLQELQESNPNEPFFSLDAFDVTILSMFESGDLQYANNYLSIAPLSFMKFQLRSHPLLQFFVDSCKHIPFEDVKDP